MSMKDKSLAENRLTKNALMLVLFWECLGRFGDFRDWVERVGYGEGDVF